MLSWFVYYVIRNATESVSSRMMGYAMGSCGRVYGRICGNFYPTLKRGKCYVIINGVITEFDPKKKYVISDGDLTEKIEDNWLAL